MGRYKTAALFFKQDLEVLKKLNELLPKNIDNYFETSRIERINSLKNLNKDEKEELRKIKEFLYRAIEEKKKTGKTTEKIDIKNERIGKVFVELLESFSFPKKFNAFIREMSLVYLISRFEQYLTSVLDITLRKKQEILKFGKKTLTYNEILDSGSMEILKNKMIEKEIISLIGKDIEEINNDLKEKFKIKLDKTKEWSEFKECFYRRNILMHNDLLPNEIYVRKTRYTGEKNRLDITKNYLSRSIILFELFGTIVEKEFDQKFG